MIWITSLKAGRMGSTDGFSLTWMVPFSWVFLMIAVSISNKCTGFSDSGTGSTNDPASDLLETGEILVSIVCLREAGKEALPVVTEIWRWMEVGITAVGGFSCSTCIFTSSQESRLGWGSVSEVSLNSGIRSNRGAFTETWGEWSLKASSCLMFPLSLWLKWFEQAKGASLDFNLLLRLDMCCMLAFLDFVAPDTEPEVCFEEDWGDALLTAASVRIRVVGVNELACVLTRGGEVLRAGALWDKGSDDFLGVLDTAGLAGTLCLFVTASSSELSCALGRAGGSLPSCHLAGESAGACSNHSRKHN